MIIFVISLLAYVTLQQCEEQSVILYNSQLRSGLLPTYLFPDAIDTAKIKLLKFNTPIIVTSNQGWTLNATYFTPEALTDTQTYTGQQQGVTQSGTITVANPTITVEVGFEFNNGTIKNGQGVLILAPMTSAQYAFQVTVANEAYKFAYVSSQIDFSQTLFSDIYANYPYTTGQLEEIMGYLNQNPVIQQGLNAYYSTNTNGNLKAALTKELKNFEIIKGVTSEKTFKFGSALTGVQSFPFNIIIQNAQLTYVPYVSYMVSAQMNINGLTTPYVCENPVTNAVSAQTGVNIEMISMDEIINSFTYAYNKGYFTTTLNPQNWKVPFFSWSTGGLNNIITSAYTTLAYASQIAGSCQATAAEYLTAAQKSFSVTMTFTCTVTASKTSTLLGFTVDFPTIEIGIGFSKLEAKSYLEVLAAPEPIITLQPNATYPLTSEPLITWYIQQGIDNSFVKNKFYEGLFDSQRETVSDLISYSIVDGAIVITNEK